MTDSPDKLKEIRDASNKFEFHILSFIGTLLELRKWKEAGSNPSIASNAIEDSFLIHARVLIDFLGEARWPSDVNYKYFLDAEEGSKKLDDKFLKEQKFDIDKRVAHLTTTNLMEKISDWEWPLEEIAEHLGPPLRTYLERDTASKLEEKDRKSGLALLEKIGN